MILDNTSNHYHQLVRKYFADQPQVAEALLLKSPTPADFHHLTKNELRYLKGTSPTEVEKFLLAVQLGELIVKSPRNLYGHAYSSALVGEELYERVCW